MGGGLYREDLYPAGIPREGVHPGEELGTPPQRSASGGIGQTTPGTKNAGGTHPTEMLSCF